MPGTSGNGPIPQEGRAGSNLGGHPDVYQGAGTKGDDYAVISLRARSQPGGTGEGTPTSAKGE